MKIALLQVLLAILRISALYVPLNILDILLLVIWGVLKIKQGNKFVKMCQIEIVVDSKKEKGQNMISTKPGYFC